MPAYDDARSEGNGESVQCTRSRGMQWAASRMRIAHHSAVLKRQRLAMATQHRRAARARRPLHLRTNVARYRGQTAVNCGRVGRHRGDANHAGAVLPGLCLATVGVRPLAVNRDARTGLVGEPTYGGRYTANTASSGDRTPGGAACAKRHAGGAGLWMGRSLDLRAEGEGKRYNSPTKTFK
jgi:hypothetical protein